jgi:hypothetical protein
MSNVETFTPWFFANQEMFMHGEIMTMANVEVEIMEEEIWQLYSVQDSLILIATIDQTFNKLIVEVSTLLLLMTLGDSSLVAEVSTDN